MPPQRDDDDAGQIELDSNLVPYDRALLNNIESSFKTGPGAKTAAGFAALGATISLKVGTFTSVPAIFSTGWDAFKRCVTANNNNPFRVVAAAVILINNNNGSNIDAKTYGLGFFGLAQSNEGSLSNDLVNAWNAAIDQFQNPESFGSFPAFASARCIKNVAEFPICKHAQVLCHSNSKAPLRHDRFLDSGGIWINSASLLRRMSAPNVANNINSNNNNNRSNTNGGASISLGGQRGRGGAGRGGGGGGAGNRPSANREFGSAGNRALQNIASSSAAQQVVVDGGVISNFSSKVPNFIVGESGSGKTAAAMIAGKDEIILFSTPHSDMNADIVGTTDEVLEPRATERFISLIAACVDSRVSSRISRSWPKFQHVGSKDFDGWRVPWENRLHDKKILIVLDEFVKFPKLCRCFCRLWPGFRKQLHNLLCCEREEQIYFVIVGTGAVGVENPPGSLPFTYQVFTVCADSK